MSLQSASGGNRLLAALSSTDRALLRPALQWQQLDVRHSIEEPNEPIRHVYFLDSGIASVVATANMNADVEIGIIGREGVTGSAVIMGNDRSPHQTYIQIGGAGQRMTVSNLRRAMDRSQSLRATLLRSVLSFNTQTAHTAVANAKAKIEERLARWLLMAHDRIDGNDVPLTHEFLALVLGVRRAGVTVALQGLERLKLVRTTRGKVSMLNRERIEELANGFYGVPESELRRLMGTGARARKRV